MKRTVGIPKKRLAAPIDFGAVISSRSAQGVKLEYSELGFMQTTGSVVLFDAYVASHRYEPLNCKCGPIAFPFWLSCMTDSGERIAYCGLRFSEEQPVEWQLVHDAGALARLVIDPYAASTVISSGVCAFASADAYEEYYSHIKDEVHPLAGTIVLDGQTHAAVKLYGKTIAVFSTGWGDGRYRCYKGIDAAGNVAAVIVDFGMIEYPAAPDDELVEVEIDVSDGAYVYDPHKTEAENNIARWTAALEGETDPIARHLAFSRRGYAFHSTNNIAAALADYNSAVAECKNITDRGVLLRAWSVYDNAADIYIRRGDLESAIALMTDALSVHDNFYTGAYVRLIDLYQQTKRTDKAAEIAAQLLSQRPNDPVANMKYAEVCVAAMNYAEAAKTYARLASDFQLYENLFDEASCLIELDDLDGADAALESHPAREYNEQYWYYKAYIYFKRGKYYDALKLAEKSHDMDKEYMPPLYLLIDIHSLLQEYHAVARYAEEYKKLRPDKEYGYSVCAEAHMVLGNFSECSRNYGYIYDEIVAEDKYAALAAITAVKTGDNKRKRKLLKYLRRKRSPYYGAAIYAVYITKYRSRDTTLSNVVYNLNTVDDFLLQLAVYLTNVNDIVPATRILDILNHHNPGSFEVVAQQIRIAARQGDNILFDNLVGYYINSFVGNVTAEERAELTDRFRSVGILRHVDWDQTKSDTPEALGLVRSDSMPLEAYADSILSEDTPK